MAMATAERFWFVDELLELPERDTLRVWVEWMCIYASEVLLGNAPTPYEQRLAEVFARSALMPADEFRDQSDADDQALAMHFNVPVEQVAARRLELDEVA